MKIPSHTRRSFKDVAIALIEEYRNNAERYGFFNNINRPTIFRIESVGSEYMLFHGKGVFRLNKAAFLFFVRRAIKGTVPVKLHI